MHTLIDRYRNALTLIGFAVALAVGTALGWKLRPSERAIVETPQPAIQLSNATVLERAPGLAVPQALLTAAKEVKGAKLERAAQLSVQPKQADCDEINLELGVLRLKDDSQRLVVRADNATLTGGVDIPLDRSLARAPKWSVGALYNPVDRTYGAYVDRDLVIVRAGIRF